MPPASTMCPTAAQWLPPSQPAGMDRAQREAGALASGRAARHRPRGSLRRPRQPRSRHATQRARRSKHARALKERQTQVRAGVSGDKAPGAVHDLLLAERHLLAGGAPPGPLHRLCRAEGLHGERDWRDGDTAYVMWLRLQLCGRPCPQPPPVPPSPQLGAEACARTPPPPPPHPPPTPPPPPSLPLPMLGQRTSPPCWMHMHMHPPHTHPPTQHEPQVAWSMGPSPSPPVPRQLSSAGTPAGSTSGAYGSYKASRRAEAKR